MDSLPRKTVGGTTEQLSFAGCIPSSDNSVNKGVAFATRKVSELEEVMLPGAASEKWNQAIKIDCQAGHKRNVTVADITSKISGTSLATLTSEPVEKCPSIGETETEPAHWPVIDPSLIESTQVAKTALLQPYRPSHISPSAQTIAREVHGLQHSCRAAIWAVALLQQRKLHGDRLAREFPDQMIPLLIKTCLFHDTGREGDGFDTLEWERASADNLREHLRNICVDQSPAWQCGEAICHKDNPKGCEHLPEAIQTLRSLLHDADTLEVMRIRRCFYMDRLECFADCQDDLKRQDWRLLAEEVCRVIARQGDLWCPIKLQDSEANHKHFFSIGAATRCENTKKQWEHHPSPFSYQLFSIGEQSGVVRELITPYTGQLTEPPASSFSLAKLTPQAGAMKSAAMEECHSTWPAALHNDPVSQQVYSVKPASCELSARNQLLMANLAGLLGITVPQSFVHEEQGHFYVVSPVPEQWQGKLKGGEATLRSLSSEQWARLLLINVIVGNESMVNSAWEGIELTPEGEPVMFHWDYAGMATRYPCPEKPEPASKTDDFSSMPLLLNKLRNPQALLYRELTSEDSKHHPGIKGIVSSCGEERIQLLFEQNPQLLEGKLDSLDGFELKRKSRIKSIDFSGCSMKGTILPSITFQQCKFNTELLNSAIVGSCFFARCSFEGERFSSSVLDNVRFYTPGGKDGEVLESTCQISRILYQSCVNENNEFNLENWLEVMGKSDYLCYFSTSLDDLSRDILSQHIDEIIRTYPQQLHKIIYGLFSIEFKSTANAINFVRNNPEFYHSQIKDLKDVYFEFRTTFLKEGDYNSTSGNPLEELCPLNSLKDNDFSRESVLSLMLNVMNLVLFPESNDKYIDFGVNANSTDEHDDCLKEIPEGSSESIQNNSILSLQIDGLPLAEMEAYKAFFCNYQLKVYREYFHQFWKECSEESQLRIAKHCLLHQNIAVSPLTTIEFFNSLPEGHDEQYWLEINLANMSKHTKNQDEWDQLLSEYFGKWGEDNRYY
ncbi:hypothetical protein [Endozoicomonas sp. ALC066]|uniref:hypothetical protein n=1 Tax=Endozoicomonas sp. ALC066 TaxID=3403078 RepID=UPI003BB4B8E5